MKKLISLILCLAMIISLCACSGKSTKAEPTDSASAAETPVVTDAPVPGAEEQLELILQNRPQWDCTEIFDSEYEHFWYAVTDLDRNGRLEIFAAITQGTGIFTTGRFFEVSESFDALNEYSFFENENNIIPEVIINETEKYTDNELHINYYVFNDTTRNGAAEHYNSIVIMSLKDGKVQFNYLASTETLAHDESHPIVNYYDGKGNKIEKNVYNSAVSTALSDLAKSTQHFGWFRMVDGELSELLSASWQVFDGKLTAMPDLSGIAAPAPAAEIPIGSNGSLTITKNPTSEALNIGGKTWFIAHADNAESIAWRLTNPDGIVYSVSEAMQANPGLELLELEGDTIAVDNVPASLNGWSVQAVFSNASYSAATAPAYIYVGDFAGAYASVLDKYKAAYAEGNIGYETAERLGISEMAAYSQSAGYALKDLNKDGTPELIIAGVDPYMQGETMLYEIDTLINGNVVNVCTSRARDRFYLRTDNLVLNVGSGGAAYTNYVLLQFNGSALTPVIELCSDLDENAEAFWYYTDHTVSGEPSKLGYDEGWEIANGYESAEYLPYLTKIA